jgi:pimeloyl-ACP methyl ester carboxylesterase
MIAAEVPPMPEPTRARYPDEEGFAERAGVRLFYEVYGDGDPTLLLLCPGVFAHSRVWKAQIPYLARHARVVTFDTRGCGRSDRPRGVAAYDVPELVEDALAVMDATATDRAVVVSADSGTRQGLALVARHPDRVAGAAFIGPYLPLTPWPPVEAMWSTFDEARRWRRALVVPWHAARGFVRALRSRELLRTYARFARRVRFFEGLTKFSRDYWLKDQRRFLEWSMPTLNFNEPHSTRQIEDGIAWGMETDADILADAWTALDVVDTLRLRDPRTVRELCAGIRCPVLVIQGRLDISVPPAWGKALAEATGGRLVLVEDAAHEPHARKPVPVNLALREFAESCRAAGSQAAAEGTYA